MVLLKGLVLALTLSVVFASDVIDLDGSNFDSVVGQNDGVFVEFFAPWCGHCKSLAPEYEIVGTTFKGVAGVKIAKVDADQHKDLAGRFEIRGYPTLKWFPAGSLKAEDYSGGRTAEDIVEFVNGKSGTQARVKKAPTAVTVLTPSNFDAIVKDTTKDVLVEFYAPWCGHCKRLAPDYEKAAQALDGESHVVVASLDADKYREVAQDYGIQGYPTLKWFPKDNKAGEEYTGGRTPEDFVNFFNQKSGTQRTVGGGVTAEAGRVAALDELAKRFVSDASSRSSTLAEAETIAKSLDEKQAAAGKYYLLCMKRIAERGAAYTETEKARLQKVIDSGSVNNAKKLQFLKNINILNSFSA
eukprot:TRINITY_DN6_c0_g2_i1.p1 TRINITY_DN6_c0_g2~~TRINITY_DN6_c0_g2_i1.p1  ORF type:complete len:356 (+),score=167.06 TRINITY_DN6_c0_g2_i1:49-1116(+)